MSNRYRHLCQSQWDVQFLSKAPWVAWLDQQLQKVPLGHGEPLVDYVRIQVANQKAVQTSVAPSPAPSPAPRQAQVQQSRPQAHAQHQQQPHRNAHFHPQQQQLAHNSNGTMTGEDGFSDMLDLSSYAGEESSGADGYAEESLLGPSYPAASNGSGQNLYAAYSATGAPSPMSAYAASHSGAIAPFSQTAYSGPVTPFTPHLDGAAVYPASTLALQGQLINEERQRVAASTNGAFLQHPTATASFFSPQAFQQQPSAQPALTITPSALSTAQSPPIASTSSVSAKTTKSSTSSASKARAMSPPVSSSSKRSRTASPVIHNSKDWTDFVPTLRQHLTSKRLSGAALSTAQKVVEGLAMFSHVDKSSTLSPWGDSSDVPPEGRAEILSQLIKYGKDEFWKAWVEVGKDGGGSSSKGKEKEGAAPGKVRSGGMELLQRWLEGAARSYSSASSKDGDEKEKKNDKAKAKNRKELEQYTLAPVLQVLVKLPLTFDHLVAYNVAVLVKRISNKAPEGGAVKAAATQLVSKWKKVQEAAKEASKDDGKSSSSASAAAMKRKTEAADGPAKKPKTVEKEQAKKPTLPIKEKVALPSFSKKKVEPNPFLAALGGLKKDPAAAAPPAPAPKPLAAVKPRSTSAASPVPEAEATPSTSSAKLGKNGKKKKTVRWRPDEELVAIREIERANYEDEDNKDGSGARVFAEGEDAAANFRDMEMQEGQTLHMHLDVEMDEEIDYYEPIPVAVPETEDFAFSRQAPDSAEAAVQTAREASLMAVDPSSTPPDSPGEPPEEPALDEKATNPMVLHSDLTTSDILEIITLAQAGPPNATEFVPADQLENLLGQLTGGGLFPPAPAASAPSPVAPHSASGLDEATLAELRRYPPAQIQNILASNPQFAGVTLESIGVAPPPPQAHYPPPAYDAPPPSRHYPPPHDPHQVAPGGYGQPHYQPHPPSGYGGPPAWVPPTPNYPGGGGPNHYNGLWLFLLTFSLQPQSAPLHTPAMHTTAALGVLLAASQAVVAFKGSSPIIGWSSQEHSFLPSLASPISPSSPSSKSQQPFASLPTDQDDLCALSTLLVFSAPGLHYSDLALLPSARSSPAGIRSALAHFGQSGTAGSALTVPYVSTPSIGRSSSSAPARVIRRFVEQCGARIEGANEASFWQGEGDKTVKVVEVGGLDKLDLIGQAAKDERKAVVADLDTAVSTLAVNLPHPFAVMIAALPSIPTYSKRSASEYRAPRLLKWKRPQLVKRQAISDELEQEYVEELLDEIATEDALEEMIEKMEEIGAVEGDAIKSAPGSTTDAEEYAAGSSDIGVTDVTSPTSETDPTLAQLEAEEYAAEDPYTASDWDGSSLLDVTPGLQDDGRHNGTSIFQPKEKSGLLHRYVFFTPALVFSILVTLLVLIPTVLLGAQALTNIETVEGLETKMAGTVGLDASKA
ncbi:hypothetical protein JCM11641_006809 [Rhodosporidiobolus odoratus]